MPWLAYKRAMNPAVYVGLFMLGAAIAAALPRPLQEDRRASNEFRRQKHKTVSSSSAKNEKSEGGRTPRRSGVRIVRLCGGIASWFTRLHSIRGDDGRPDEI